MMQQMAGVQIPLERVPRPAEVDAVVEGLVERESGDHPAEQDSPLAEAEDDQRGRPQRRQREPCADREDGVWIAMMDHVERGGGAAQGMAEPAVDYVLG